MKGRLNLCAVQKGLQNTWLGQTVTCIKYNWIWNAKLNLEEKYTLKLPLCFQVAMEHEKRIITETK